MAIVTTAMSGARFFASVAFGLLWTRYGADTAVYAFFGALVVAVVIAGGILRLQPKRDDLYASSK